MNNLLVTHNIFGTKHIILIFLSIVIIIISPMLIKNKSLKSVSSGLLIIGLISETIKIFYYIIQNEDAYGGILPKTDLPFHLCSIQILFITIICFIKNEKIKRGILSFMLPSCLVGGMAAILIATTTSLNGAWIITAQYFLYHCAIVVYAIYLFINKEICFTIKDYYSCLIFLVIIFFFSFYINSILYNGTDNINFMYVASPPQDGLPYLTEKYGWLVYIIHYAFLVIVAITLCYIKPIIITIKKQIKAWF